MRALRVVMLIACASEAIPADFHAQPRHDVAFHNFEDAVALSAAADTNATSAATARVHLAAWLEHTGLHAMPHAAP